MLEIEVWSDYACPYCYIGKRQLKEVLAEMDIEDVRFRHRVFVLEPGKESRPEQSFFEGLNITDEGQKEKTLKIFDSISHMAAENGLDYKLMDIPDVSTIDAHRLTLWAQEQDEKLSEKLSDLIFHTYFEKAQDISDRDILCDLAKEAGLDIKKACSYLSNDVVTDQIKADVKEAEEKDIDLVPHFFFNGDHDVLGVTTKALLREAVSEALNDQNS